MLNTKSNEAFPTFCHSTGDMEDAESELEEAVPTLEDRSGTCGHAGDQFLWPLYIGRWLVWHQTLLFDN